MLPTCSRGSGKPSSGLGVLIVCLAGCGGPALQFAEVEGKVTLNDQPLSGVVVRFYPINDAKEQLPYSTALSDDTGVYRLTSEEGKPGALVGPHQVVVYWPSRDMLGERAADAPAPPPKTPIPLMYTVASDSPLRVEVNAGARQTINLPLKSAKKS